MAKAYGIPYMGSKNSIAPWVVEHLPRTKTLVEPFAGGCAVTHCAMEQGAFEEFVCNDITDAPRLFVDAIAGKYANEERWISREDFAMFKDGDPYIRYCWSFGNRGESYLYAKEIENVKKAMWELVFCENSRDEKIKHIRKAVKAINSMVGETSENNLTRLQSLERLQRLQSLETLKPLLQRITTTQTSYTELDIPTNATVYCDPPYRGTAQYNGETFDHVAFDKWVNALPYMIIISEYTAPAGCVEVARIGKHQTLSVTSTRATERLFVQERFADEYNERMHGNEQQPLFAI